MNAPRVVHLSANDLQGGAGRAAFRLHTGLRQAGADSAMLVLQRASADPAVHQFRPFPAVPRAVGHLLFRACRRAQNVRLSHGELFSTGRTLYGRSLLAQLPPADVVNLHWVVDLLDYSAALPALAARAPLVWTSHDMNGFTGGCHYDGGCDRFSGRCGACPQLGSRRERDLSRSVFTRKERALARVPVERLKIVSPSRWLARETERSTLGRRYETIVIPNGIDPEEFFPVEPAAARRELGLPVEGRVVLFVADFLNDRRKGFPLLLEALRLVSDAPDLTVLTLGLGEPRGVPAPNHIHLGRINDQRRLVLAYSAADLFIIPSLQDNLPNTILEAMACGTPVLGFDTGGMADLIVPEETGLLAQVGDPADLARQLRWLLDHPGELQAMGAAARRAIVARYTVEIQVAAYLRLYESLTVPSRS
jgi:glycosyltransferase involved in cell wall biosynthesis